MVGLGLGSLCVGLSGGKRRSSPSPTTPPRLLEFLGLAPCVGKRGGKEVKPRSPTIEGRGARECLEFVFLAPCVGKRGGKEVKETSPDIEGQPETKIPKIPKIPIIVDVI